MQKMLDLIRPEERKDLLIACVALSLAFTLVFIRGGWTPLFLVVVFVSSVVTVGLGFILHELAHKFTAVRFGYWAAFRKDNQMLLVAVALAALVGVVFAAPGATMIYVPPGREMTKEENGKISVAGPIVNLVLGAIFLVVLLAGAAFALWPLMVLGTMGLSVNGMIAFFNLLPVSILDGRKVIAWSPVVFAVVIVLALGMILLSLNFGGSLTMLQSLVS